MFVYDNKAKILYGSCDTRLKASKLANDEKCLICNDSKSLYKVEYCIAEYLSNDIGIYCYDCLFKIFKLDKE